MGRCEYFGCRNISQNAPSAVHYFRFPKEVERSRLWVEYCGRPDLYSKSATQLYMSYRLCSNHFEDEMFVNYFEKRRLLPQAVPKKFKDDLIFLSRAYLSEKIPSPPSTIKFELSNENIEIALEIGTDTDTTTAHFQSKKAGESTQKSEPTGSAPLPTSTVLLPEARARVQPSTSTTAPATTDPLIKLEEPSCSRIQEPGIDTTLEFLPEPSEQPVVNVAPKPKPTYKGRKDRIYCRLCLKTSNKNSLTPLSVVDFNYPGKSDAFKKKKAEKVEEIQKMIKFCLPFFDSLTFNPIICSICLARLRSSYDFANECLKNQRLVEKYADMYGATERIININEMVESKFALSEDESESDTDTDNTTQSIPKVTRSSARVSHQKTGEKYSHEDGPATKKQKIYNESQEENSLASSNEDTPCIKTEPHEEDDTILKEFLTQDMPTRDTDPDNIDNIADESMIKIEPEYIDSPDFIKAEPVDDLHVENEIFNKRTGIGTDIQEQHSHFPKTEKDVLDTGTIVPSTTREPVFFNVDSSLETTTSDVN